MSTSTPRALCHRRDLLVALMVVTITALASTLVAGDPAGACCLRDGNCAVLTFADCEDEGGWYRGDDTECASFDCPDPRGACCLDDAPCTEQTEVVCAELGGDYQGNSVLCMLIDCPGDGACCLEDGSCTDGFTQSACESGGGAYQGDDTTCGPADCIVPLGACCLPGDVCLPLPLEACDSLGGLFLGEGTDCDETECPSGIVGENAGDAFGRSVITVGDLDSDGHGDIVVAAPSNDEGGTDAGRVTVFSGRTFELLYTRRGSSADEHFGTTLASAGDVDGDGAGDFIVGSPDFQNARGRVKVYSGRTGQRLFTMRGRNGGDRFGFAVAGGIDIDADGRDDILVGAPYDDRGGHKAGSVTVYSGRDGSKIATLFGESKGDAFGWSVAAVGRVNSDAHGDFVVGAPKNDERASNAGRVFVYSGRHMTTLYTIEGKRKGDQFGRVVSALGRVDRDGRDDFAVGSPLYDKSSANNVGRVDVYSGRDGDRLWSKTGQHASDQRGSAIAPAGDIDGDGRMDVLLGTPRFDGIGGNSGRVDVHTGDTGAAILTISGEAAGDQLGFATSVLFTPDGPAVLAGAPGSDQGASNAGLLVIEVAD